MWYAQNNASKKEDKAEKKLREARQTVKWLPYVGVLVAATAIFECVILAKHPGMERSLHLVSTVGAMLYLLSHWARARAVLAGARETWSMGTFSLGALLMCSGPTLADMWHHKQMTLFYPFAIAILLATLLCLGIIALELFIIWRPFRRT